MRLNKNYDNLQENKIAEHKNAYPDIKIINMGIDDVTLALCESVITAMHKAVDDMSRQKTFKGYAPKQGYDFLKTAIQTHYKKYNVTLDTEDIFISDGAKSDLANILDLFDTDNTVLISDPFYPAYVEANIMAGRKIIYMNAVKENNFLPLPDENIRADIIYLCSPNNPTGAVYTYDQLKKWVDYAIDNNAVILFDAVYESFISGNDLPHSIFEIDGAEKCAVEFCSLSKTAGFTGVRCGYTVIPSDLPLNKMWLRRQTTKFNGVSYIAQRGAEAVFSESGQRQIRQMITYYKYNAEMIISCLDKMGIYYTGGINTPYVWFECPHGMDSWSFYDYLLEKTHILGTPGSVYGKNGENYFRFTAFGNAEDTIEAVKRIKTFM